MESAMSGILAGINAVCFLQQKPAFILPDYTMMGALSAYISNPAITDFQPMGANFGVLPPLENPPRQKKERYGQYAARSLAYFDTLQEV